MFYFFKDAVPRRYKACAQTTIHSDIGGEVKQWEP